MSGRAAAVLLVALGLAPGAARAGAPEFFAVLPPVTVKEAFADHYGQAILREFGAILRGSAGSACLRDKGIEPGTLQSFGEDLLARRGQAWIDMVVDFIDAAKADAEFRRLGGPGALAELRDLAADPVVREFLEIGRPARLDNLVDRVIEEFDRYVLLNRIQLSRQLSPYATGSVLMAESRAEPSEDAAEAFAEANQTPALRRFRELAEVVMAEAIAAATDRQRLLQHGPAQSFPGLQAELKAHCID